MLDSLLIRGILFYIWWFCHALQKKILNIILWISSKIPHTHTKNQIWFHITLYLIEKDLIAYIM